MFDTTKEDLKDLLHHVHEGKLQLPDFQRDYIWNDDDVRSLIASIAKGYPVGALLILQTGGEVEFKPRPLKGAPVNGISPEDLLLDGQQRMTSLYQAMYAETPIQTLTQKNKAIERFYYLDIERAASDVANIEDAIIGVPADRVIRKHFGREVVLNLSSKEAEYKNDLFPLNQIFDSTEWHFNWRIFWQKEKPNRIELEQAFFKDVIDRIRHYKMPIIRLYRNNNREAICLVFEKVNVGGKKLNAFELVTAIYAGANFDLRKDWLGTQDPLQLGRRERLRGTKNPRDVLHPLKSTDFLQACTLLHTREQRLKKAAEGAQGKELPQVSCKRDALLGLPLEAYQKYADAVEQGFIDAASFLNERKIIWHKDIPYPPQLVTLGAVFAILDKSAQSIAVKNKLARWFWSVTFGEMYGSSTESRIARDVSELIDWLKGDETLPRSIDEAFFQQERLKSLRIRLSAAYKGLHALLMHSGCRDFVTGAPVDIMTFFNDQIDIHHVFPRAWCKEQGIPAAVYDSIVNKTPLSKASNIAIGGEPPSVYLQKIEQKQSINSAEIDDILRTHLIEPQHLRNDDFETFMRVRTKALSDIIARAMGKPVVEEAGADEQESEIDMDMHADEENNLQ